MVVAVGVYGVLVVVVAAVYGVEVYEPGEQAIASVHAEANAWVVDVVVAAVVLGYDGDEANVVDCVAFDGAVVDVVVAAAFVVDVTFVDDDVIVVDVELQQPLPPPQQHFACAADVVMENVVDVAHDDVDFVVYDYVYVVVAVGQPVVAIVDDVAVDTD